MFSLGGMLLLLSRFSCVQLCDPTEGSPPGSPVPGILQAGTLERVAISFSNACMLGRFSRVRLCATPWTDTEYMSTVTHSHKSRGGHQWGAMKEKGRGSCFGERGIRVDSSDLMVFLLSSIKNPSKEK